MVRWLKKLFGGKQERQEKQDSQRSFNQAPPPPEGGARTSAQPPAASDNTWATSTRPRPAPPKNPLESLAADEQQQAAVAKAERVSAILRDEPLNTVPNDPRPPRLPMAMEQELPGAALNQAPASPILNDSVGRQSSTAWSSGGTAFSRPNSGRTTNTWTPSEAGSRPTSGATVASRPKSGRSRGGVVQPTSDFSLHQKQGAAAKEEPASFGSLMRRRPQSGGRTIDPLSSPHDSDFSTPPPSSGGAFACINSDEKGGPSRNKMQMNDPFFSPPGGV